MNVGQYFQGSLGVVGLEKRPRSLRRCADPFQAAVRAPHHIPQRPAGHQRKHGCQEPQLLRPPPGIDVSQERLDVVTAHLNRQNAIAEITVAPHVHVLETDHHVRRIVHGQRDHVGDAVGVGFRHRRVDPALVRRHEKEIQARAGRNPAQVHKIARMQRKFFRPFSEGRHGQPGRVARYLRRGLVEFQAAGLVRNEQFRFAFLDPQPGEVYTHGVPVAAGFADEIHAHPGGFSHHKPLWIQHHIGEMLRNVLLVECLTRRDNQFRERVALKPGRFPVGACFLNGVVQGQAVGTVRRLHGRLDRATAARCQGQEQAEGKRSRRAPHCLIAGSQLFVPFHGAHPQMVLACAENGRRQSSNFRR